ncbi:MAG: molecular chaperone DnaJ [Gemmatimonadaceae bacterium]|nr:molecular chaperone DnaJ [Gemmatimonadaceae bacterium]
MADYYALLEVPRNASDDEIKKSYRKLAMQWHPDRNGGSKEAEERFKLITEAYDILRDPEKRQMYDRYGDAAFTRGGGGGGQQWQHVDLSEALNIFMRDFGGFGGLGDMFGQRGGPGPRSGGDLKIAVPLTLAEVATGVEKQVTLKVLDPCGACTGSGAEPGSQPTRCATCGGAGEVRRAQRSFLGQFVSVAPCPSCAGEGVVIPTPCKKCKGEGRVRAEKTLNVRIPAGVATGQYMTIRGQGNAGARGGGRGDVLVVFEVEEDERFERDGEDLYTEVAVTYPQLVLGAELDVPAILGALTLRVPAGTQSGQVFNLRGRGLPRVNASGVGDLHVRVQLVTPSSGELSAEERELIERLAAVRPASGTVREKGIWTRMKEALGG